MNQNNRAAHQRVMQQREDDEEDWEGGGPRKRNQPAVQAPNYAMGALGIAALSLGAYAVSTFFSRGSGSTQQSLAKTEAELKKLLIEMEKDIKEYPVIGMDCQWTQTFDNNRSQVALLQLATHKGKVMLVPLRQTSIPKELRDLLLNPNVVKAGIEGTKDSQYLREDYQIEVRSTFDIRFLAEDTGNRPEGLEKLSKTVLDLDLGRDWETVSSDWDKPSLEAHQISYAKTSVKAEVDIFKTLYGYLNAPNDDILSYCRPNLDKPFTWFTQKWD